MAAEYEADTPTDDAVDVLAPMAMRLARGVCRLLADMGYASLTEFPLGNGRRADVLGVDGSGKFLIVEIKTSLADFRADHKWPEYLDYCDRFYYVVPDDFPQEALPDEPGLIIADEWGGDVLRHGPDAVMNGSRRRAQMLRLARTATMRLGRVGDPEP